MGKIPISQYPIEQKIFMLRGRKVMLSLHLAQLYNVQTKILMQAVKRNIKRFPEDFMFQLSDSEYENLKLQIVTSSWGGARRAKPYAFTEQGVAMLSGVLNSERAIQVNIAIMRAFVKLREVISNHKELAAKLNELEQKVENHDKEIKAIFDAIRQLTMVEEEPKRRIGFHSDEED
jgi:outer membrane murein-binding lipoprotein Lpp